MSRTRLAGVMWRRKVSTWAMSQCPEKATAQAMEESRGSSSTVPPDMVMCQGWVAFPSRSTRRWQCQATLVLPRNPGRRREIREIASMVLSQGVGRSPRPGRRAWRSSGTECGLGLRRRAMMVYQAAQDGQERGRWRCGVTMRGSYVGSGGSGGSRREDRPTSLDPVLAKSQHVLITIEVFKLRMSGWISRQRCVQYNAVVGRLEAFAHNRRDAWSELLVQLDLASIHRALSGFCPMHS